MKIFGICSIHLKFSLLTQLNNNKIHLKIFNYHLKIYKMETNYYDDIIWELVQNQKQKSEIESKSVISIWLSILVELLHHYYLILLWLKPFWCVFQGRYMLHEWIRFTLILCWGYFYWLDFIFQVIQTQPIITGILSFAQNKTKKCFFRQTSQHLQHHISRIRQKCVWSHNTTDCSLFIAW